jgi:voltage-gated potassium channel Kch
MTEESGLSHVDGTPGWQWPLVCVLAVVGTPLAAYGLWQYEIAHWGHADIGSVLYHTLQMYILHTPHFEPPVNVPLQVGRWLIAGASLLTVGMALLRIFREEARLLRLRWTKGHVVVCGLGELGRQLATEFRKAGNTVVAIESHPSNVSVPQLRSQGVTVLIGDACEEATLRKAPVGHARHVLATCSDEGTNIAVATCVAAVAKPGERTGRAIEHWLFIGDPQLRATLKSRDVFPGAGPGYKVNVRGLDIYELSARQAFEAHPLDHSPILQGSSKRVHLVIAGFGQMGQAIAVQAARIGRFANGARMRITIVDPAAGTCWENFSARCPQFTQICDVDAPCEVPLDARELVEQLVTYCPDDEARDFLVTYALCFEPNHGGSAADKAQSHCRPRACRARQALSGAGARPPEEALRLRLAAARPRSERQRTRASAPLRYAGGHLVPEDAAA